jgi:hypothetical protein
MTRREKVAYLAGFLDGDGHFYKPMTVNGRGEKHKYTRIVANQARYHKGKRTMVLEWIKANFGGYLYWYKDRNLGRWSLTGSRAVELIGELLPYLTNKKKQAKAAL